VHVEPRPIDVEHPAARDTEAAPPDPATSSHSDIGDITESRIRPSSSAPTDAMVLLSCGHRIESVGAVESDSSASALL
jgi:hypothetical protein